MRTLSTMSHAAANCSWAVPISSNRSAAQGARGNERPNGNLAWSRLGAPLDMGEVQLGGHASVVTLPNRHRPTRQQVTERVDVLQWGVGDSRSRGRGRLEQAKAPQWMLDIVRGRLDILELATVLCVDSIREGVYYRRQVHSVSDLNAYDHPYALRIPDEYIAELQAILKRQFGLDYSVEQAQDAGHTILRFYGYKLLREMQQEHRRAVGPQDLAGGRRASKQAI
jgi:hypothetical protein